MSTTEQAMSTFAKPASRKLPGFLLKRFSRVLDSFDYGRLNIIWPNGRETTHGSDAPVVTLTLHNYEPIRSLVLNGKVGFAESYIDGNWTVDDIDVLFKVIMCNEKNFSPHVSPGWLSRLRNLFNHALNRNSRSGSKRNIMFHYDLGNEFYAKWLDPTMMYSSAVFDAPGQSLQQAQESKMSRVVKMLDLQADDKVLEIGCGWGSLSRAIVQGSTAQRKSVNMDAISLSTQQLAWAREHNSVAGSIDFRCQDYRDVHGCYDRIVSIEMFEAVGMAYWQRYFTRLNELLASGGTAVLQVITIAEERFENYRRNPDFIQRHVFPGGMLPTRSRLLGLFQNAGFSLVEDHWFGQDYATTLEHWRENFEAKIPDIRTLGYDERFIRLWRYYLAYCETGFVVGATNVGLLRLVKR